jgi:hypothetical protein
MLFLRLCVICGKTEQSSGVKTGKFLSEADDGSAEVVLDLVDSRE